MGPVSTFHKRQDALREHHAGAGGLRLNRIASCAHPGSGGGTWTKAVLFTTFPTTTQKTRV